MTDRDLEALTSREHLLRRRELAKHLCLISSATYLNLLGALHAGPRTVLELSGLVHCAPRHDVSRALVALVRAGLVEQEAERPAETFHLSPYGRTVVEALAPLAAVAPISPA